NGAVGLPTKSISTISEATAPTAVDRAPDCANADAVAWSPTIRTFWVATLLIATTPGWAVAVAAAWTPITNGAFTPGPTQALNIPVKPVLPVAAVSLRIPPTLTPAPAVNGPTGAVNSPVAFTRL